MNRNRKIRYTRRRSYAKSLAIITGSLLVFVGLLFGWSQHGKTKPADIQWGVTYSNLASKELGLDSRAAYKEVIEQLQPDRLRLVAYWSEIEPNRGQLNFSELDYQVELAEKAGIPYTIAIGQKVPRYPECHVPKWTSEVGSAESKKALIEHITRVIGRYDSRPNLAMWQVENEPYFDFGVCPPPDIGLLNDELDAVLAATNKPILMTDSGEGSMWLRASARADVFGTTLYRSVINDKTGEVFTHFIPPWIYALRAKIVQLIHPNVDRVIVAELQAEPWGSPLSQKLQEFTDLTLSHQKFQENIKFAQAVGFEESYLWGVEWWYFKKQQGNTEYWDSAKELFATGEVQ